jgi:hypothetical protein
MLLNLFAHMGKSIWVNPLLGDGGTVRFLGASTQKESSTSNPGTVDVVFEEVKTGFYNTIPLHPEKRQRQKCHRRGHRGKSGY